MKKITAQKNNKGFVILFAILISSVILLISSGIFNTIQKQVLLSSYSRESQRAFYAADAALECALYYDISPFIAKTYFPADDQSALEDLDCGGSQLEVNYLGPTTSYDHGFAFRYFNADDQVGCAYVLLEKTNNGGFYDTRTTAAGFNTCVDAVSGSYNFKKPDFNDPGLLERRVTIQYQGT